MISTRIFKFQQLAISIHIAYPQGKIKKLELSKI